MKLSDYFKQKKSTMTALAEKIGCGQPTISLITNGTRSPSPRLAMKIQEATNGEVTAWELLFPDTPIPKDLCDE